MAKTEKPAGKQVSSGGGGFGGAKPSVETPAASPPKPDPVAVDTYIFSCHPKNRYIDESIEWKVFRAGKIGQFRFHQLNMPEPALKAEIELFAARLDKYLLGLGYAGPEGARYAIRAAVGTASDPMQVLLTAVADTYKS